VVADSTDELYNQMPHHSLPLAPSYNDHRNDTKNQRQNTVHRKKPVKDSSTRQQNDKKCIDSSGNSFLFFRHHRSERKEQKTLEDEICYFLHIVS
jgi:hypothetical protein